MTPRETYVQAKIEHYVEKAEAYFAMARYPAASRALHHVLALDPDNQACMGLRHRIQEQATALSRQSNGKHHHTGRGGNGSGDDSSGQTGHQRGLVVMIDQDERLLSQLAGVLPRHGYRFAGAASYDEALELFSLVTPDVVISEVNFDAGARGFDLFLWLRTHTTLARTPFMFHATRIDPDVLLAGKRLGVDDFLLKPVDGAILAAAAAHAMNRRRSLPVPS